MRAIFSNQYFATLHAKNAVPHATRVIRLIFLKLNSKLEIFNSLRAEFKLCCIASANTEGCSANFL